jgi:hypothetical protein
MEHRYYPRINIFLEVEVFKNGAHIGTATTKDISLGGMMLEYNDFFLKKNDVVGLRIWINREPKSLRGFVVESNKTHTNIMFVNMSKAAKREYLDFLREKVIGKRLA